MYDILIGNFADLFLIVWTGQKEDTKKIIISNVYKY